MTRQQRFEAVVRRFKEIMPEAETELHYSSPFQLLVAVILSAQCTDKRVNMITPQLFAAYPDAAAMAQAEQYEIYEYIKSCSYPNNKARSLAGMARLLNERFNGQVPSDMDDLLSLPGVGRKTANVIMSVIFGKAAMAVDTHVFRVSERLGLTTGSRSPLSTEKTLIRYIPESDIAIAHHWLILHGRYVCKARNPQCGQCELNDLCRKYENDIKKAGNTNQ
ncbi:MAG: endonuclease III [Muribaculaceae bacterium]|nr:endonuclease III [Muribaculaceae bacterium]